MKKNPMPAPVSTTTYKQRHQPCTQGETLWYIREDLNVEEFGGSECRPWENNRCKYMIDRHNCFTSKAHAKAVATILKNVLSTTNPVPLGQ